MSTTSPLPRNWTAVLDQIEQTLSHASRLAEVREAAPVERVEAPPSSVTPDLLAKYMAGLEHHIQQIQGPLTALDETLQREEDHVRRHLAEVAALRQRLADWSGRAAAAFPNHGLDL